MRSGKWGIPVEEYSYDYYTPYCSGSAYILTGDLPKRMYETSRFLKFFWIDDFYITGLLVDAVNATLRSFNSMYVVNRGLVESQFSSKKGDHTVFGHIPNAMNNMYKLWMLTLERQVCKYPYLKSSHGHLLKEYDFFYAEEFKWTTDLWRPYLENDISVKNQSVFDLETF